MTHDGSDRRPCFTRHHRHTTRHRLPDRITKAFNPRRRYEKICATKNVVRVFSKSSKLNASWGKLLDHAGKSGSHWTIAVDLEVPIRKFTRYSRMHGYPNRAAYLQKDVTARPVDDDARWVRPARRSAELVDLKSSPPLHRISRANRRFRHAA